MVGGVFNRDQSSIRPFCTLFDLAWLSLVNLNQMQLIGSLMAFLLNFGQKLHLFAEL